MTGTLVDVAEDLRMSSSGRAANAGAVAAKARQRAVRTKSFSLVKHVAFASAVMAFLAFGLGGWAATANLAGAVIAPGTFVVERNVKKVQHSYGGIASEINVKNGDRVEAGQILLRLDATQIGAELAIIRSQLTELVARSARLAAERDNLDAINLPKAFSERSADAKLAADGEERLFEENRRTRQSQKEQLGLRIEQLREEISGVSAQRDAKKGELKIIQQELEQVRLLQQKALTPISRVYSMEREEMRLGGELGGLIAQIARAYGQISEVNVQILAVDENTRAQAQRELRTIESKLSELAEREVAAKDKLHRVDLRAPQTGRVHELSVHTVGGVVTAAEQIMLIVPEEDSLTIQARVSPTDVDQVAVGRPTNIRLTAFNQQTTPELTGHVVNVSADVTLDPKTGQNYYVARIEMDEKSRKSIGELKLIPGMPVEVFMSTGDRTALSYLSKPFTDQMNKAFRD
jgi:HlyD family type I secretion membrane fusion protein